MVPVVGRPDVVVSVDAQSVRVRKEPFADALNKIALAVVFGKHRLGSLEKKYMALRIYGDRRGFAGDYSFWKLEEVRHHPIGKFGNGLEWGGVCCRWLRPGMQWQKCNGREHDGQKPSHISSPHEDQKRVIALTGAKSGHSDR